ncbi:MAG: hypothetical protein KF784_07205 [Fimbriimonadaceae bacterium]|nr:hypothetical protein [Fimbriimonadaceae bacterium]
MSQFPPPFSPPARKSNNTVLIVIVCVVVGICLVCGIGAVASGLYAFNKVGSTLACVVNVEATRQGLMDYARANDGTLPRAETWQDDIKQYVGAHLRRDDMGPIEVMDPNGEWYCDTEGMKTGIAFNSDLSEKKLADIADKYATIAIFEIEQPRRNANEPFKRRDHNTSPKMFGEHRGWFVMPVEGEMQGMSSGGSGRVKVSTTGSSDSGE